MRGRQFTQIILLSTRRWFWSPLLAKCVILHYFFKFELQSTNLLPLVDGASSLNGANLVKLNIGCSFHHCSYWKFLYIYFFVQDTDFFKRTLHSSDICKLFVLLIKVCISDGFLRKYTKSQHCTKCRFRHTL